MSKKYLTIKATIEIDDEDNTINTLVDCLSDYDNIGRPINRLEDVGWEVEFVSLTDESGNQTSDNQTDVSDKECMDITADNIRYIRLRAGVRHWEDAEVNGEEDDNDNPTMPFAKKGEGWNITIDATTGQILNWPQGVSARVQYKTCDDNTITFIKCNGTELGSFDCYVPSCFAIDEEGYGDYIIFHIASNGKIEDWGFGPDDVEEIVNAAF